MKPFRYTLEKYKTKRSRYACPSCQKKYQFTRYIDNQKGTYVHETVGKCNRENKCGYHYAPNVFFRDRNISFETYNSVNISKPKRYTKLSPPSYINEQIFTISLRPYKPNSFVSDLTKIFTAKTISKKMVCRYLIGTTNNILADKNIHLENQVIFWQIDFNQNIRTGKIINYKNLKRTGYINWAHSLLYNEFNLKQCFFGEHLLKLEPSKTVAIVESEKTALIASVLFPKYIWLACGGLNNLSEEKCKVLKNRKVVLFPDLNAYDKWEQKAKMVLKCDYVINCFLQSNATEEQKLNGLDLADFVVEYLLKSGEKI